ASCGAPPKNFGKTAVPSVPPTRADATTRISSAPGVEFRRMSESLLEEDVLIITTDGNPGTGKQGNAQKDSSDSNWSDGGKTTWVRFYNEDQRCRVSAFPRFRALPRAREARVGVPAAPGGAVCRAGHPWAII